MLVSAAIMTCNEKEALIRCLQSVEPLVDEVVIGVDGKTRDGTMKYLQEAGYNAFVFTFTHFSSIRNQVLDRVTSPWVFVIDSDETVVTKDVDSIRRLAARGVSEQLDAFYFVRRHWYDLERTKEWTHPYPDHHIRLFDSRIRYEGRVHEGPQGVNKMALTSEIEIQHFNMYYKDLAARRKAHQLYKSLGAK